MTDYLYTETQAKRLVLKALKKLKEVFEIQHYSIIPRFRYQKRTKGSCKAAGHYEKATVNINLEMITSQKDLELTCLHEVLHIVCAKGDQLAFELAQHYDDDESKVMQRQLEREVEALTTHLTRVLYPLIFTH